MDWMLLPFRRYFDFSGRSRRKEYWMFALLMVIAYAICGAFMLSSLVPYLGTGQLPQSFTPMFWVGTVLAGLFTLAIIIPSLAVTVRRLHDRGLSGWWYLGVVAVGQVPYLGQLVNLGFLVLMCLPGQAGANRFGSDPKDPTNAEVFA